MCLLDPSRSHLRLDGPRGHCASVSSLTWNLNHVQGGKQEDMETGRVRARGVLSQRADPTVTEETAALVAGTLEGTQA